MTRFQILGATRLSRVAIPYLLDQGRARIVAVDPGDEDEFDPWFAPIRGMCRAEGISLGRHDSAVVLDLDPAARPTSGAGPMVRVVPPSNATSPDVNRLLLIGGEWSIGLINPEGTAAWSLLPIEPDAGANAQELLDHATLRGLEALAEGLEPLLSGAAPTPLPRPLKSGRFRAQEAHLLWEQPASRVVARIRAAGGPWGGARTTLGETVIFLDDAELIAAETPDGWTPGTVLAVEPSGLEVATGRGVVRLRRLRPGSRPSRPAYAYAHEVGLAVGYQFA